jgi:hypothetical protein
MTKAEADKLVDEARAVIAALGASEEVEVDDVEEALIRDSFSESPEGTWVKAWVFVPREGE